MSDAQEVGYAELALSDGAVRTATGELQNAAATAALYNTLLDAGDVLAGDPLQRITVFCSGHDYVVTLNKDTVFVSQRIPGEA